MTRIGLRSIGRFVVRVYALAVMALVLWTAYTAVTYLYRNVFTPTRLPKGFESWEGRLSANLLRLPPSEEEKFLTPHRAPLSHFHRVDWWFEPDVHNPCTAVGCHEPLPHTKYKASRAFANLHSTFLTCEMCHAQVKSEPIPATWVNIESGKPQGVPAVLWLTDLLEREAAKIRTDPRTVHEQVVAGLSRIVASGAPDYVLKYLLLELQTSEPGSPVWQKAMKDLSEELPNHARGEYRAKIAPIDREAALGMTREEIIRATREYLAAAPESGARQAINGKIHARVVEQPKGCVLCHGGQPERLDFQSVGYSTQRAKSLAGEPIAGEIQRIQRGEPFYFPNLLEGGRAR
jgi:hypothetical protein